jgi:hypothetical protein
VAAKLSENPKIKVLVIEKGFYDLLGRAIGLDGSHREENGGDNSGLHNEDSPEGNVYSINVEDAIITNIYIGCFRSSFHVHQPIPFLSFYRPGRQPQRREWR